MSLRDAWIDLLYRAATGTRAKRSLLTPVGIVIFGGFTTLFVLAALLLDRLLGLPGLLPERLRLLLSLPLAATGIVLTSWSAVHFLRVKGTPVPMNPPPTLVTSGPYRYARNPMLTGVFMILAGLGFGLDSMSLVCLFTPLYVAFNVWELKRIEEPELAKRLGGEYVEYRNGTPMFLPRVTRPSKTKVR